MLAFVMVFVFLAFGAISAIIAVALRAIFSSPVTDAVRLQALKLAGFGLRFFASVFFLGLFGLAVQAGIIPPIPIPAFLAFSSEADLQHAAILPEVERKLGMDTSCPTPQMLLPSHLDQLLFSPPHLVRGEQRCLMAR